jgi:hypothetical protein
MEDTGCMKCRCLQGLAATTTVMNSQKLSADAGARTCDEKLSSLKSVHGDDSTTAAWLLQFFQRETSWVSAASRAMRV